MRLHKAAHTVYKTQYHIVWVTRYRKKILVPGKTQLRLKIVSAPIFPGFKGGAVKLNRSAVFFGLVLPYLAMLNMTATQVLLRDAGILSRTAGTADQQGRSRANAHRFRCR